MSEKNISARHHNYRTWIEISSEALTHNVSVLRSFIDKNVTLIAVVKSNAYGHGLQEIVRILDRNQVTHFGVDSIEEAIAVRNILPSATIITLGFIPDAQLPIVFDFNIQPTIYDQEQLQILQDEGGKRMKPVSVHLKIETGTSRQGILPEDLFSFVQSAGKSPYVHIVGTSTHFSRSEEASSDETNRQVDILYKTVGELADDLPDLQYVHAACSAAILAHPKTHGTAVRAGLSLYGLWSSPEIEIAVRKLGQSIHLNPVLSWRSQVAQVKQIQPGTPVGYGGTEVVGSPTRLGVVPVGYYDGYDRRLSSTGEVLISGQRCRVVGRVCMNMMMVDVSSIPSVKRGDIVTLIGQDGSARVTADDIASKIDTINWEIVTRISPHLPRIVT